MNPAAFAFSVTSETVTGATASRCTAVVDDDDDVVLEVVALMVS